jgi:ribosomal protein L15
LKAMEDLHNWRTYQDGKNINREVEMPRRIDIHISWIVQWQRDQVSSRIPERDANTPSQLWSLVPAEKRDEYLSSSKKDVVPVIDLLPLGYSKVLGKGRLPEIPLVVRARWFSKEAERKITEAGGVVELVA